MTQKKQHCVITDENTTIDVGDEYEYHRPAWSEPSVPSQFPTLYEDENVLVVCKPAGISVIPGDMYLKERIVVNNRNKGEQLTRRITLRRLWLTKIQQ
jgi:23S rRNA-/tRNA-specific pseudouridylate synthase